MADATQTISTVAAAVAAVGSATAAIVMYRQWNGGTAPALSVDLAVSLPKRRHLLTIVNYGGPAKNVSYVVVEGQQVCMEVLLPNGFLAPGESRQLLLHLDSHGDRQLAVVYGFDLASRHLYAWAANGKASRWSARTRWWRRRPREATAAQILQRFYPDSPDPATLQKRPSVLMPNGTTATNV